MLRIIPNVRCDSAAPAVSEGSETNNTVHADTDHPHSAAPAIPAAARLRSALNPDGSRHIPPAAIPCCRPLAVPTPPTSHFTKYDVRSVHQTQAEFFSISIPSLAALPRNASRRVLRLASCVVCSVVVFCRRWVGSWVEERASGGGQSRFKTTEKKTTARARPRGGIVREVSPDSSQLGR